MVLAPSDGTSRRRRGSGGRRRRPRAVLFAAIGLGLLALLMGVGRGSCDEVSCGLDLGQMSGPLFLMALITLCVWFASGGNSGQ